jgi:UDP-glucose 4-epimerase
MKLLIIGGAGYIGGVTAHMAQEAGHKIDILDNLSTGREYNVPNDANLIKGDLCDRQFVQSVFQKTNYDAVMNFAARILVPESMQKPYEYFYTNSFGVLNAIDAAVNSGVKNYIFSSSAAVYGDPEQTPISEDSPTNPVNPYGASKLITEKLLRSYQITHDLNWAAMRYFNVAGAYNGVGTDYPYVSHIIPMLLTDMRSQKPARLFGDDYDTPDGSTIRDYVHVADVASAHLLALAKMTGGTKINQPINLGSHHGYSVKEVIATFNKVTNAKMATDIQPRRAGDPARLYATNDRAKQLLGWEPKRNLEQMIQDHYNWYKAQANPNSPITLQ